MRGAVTDWQTLSAKEQAALTSLLGEGAEARFNHQLDQAARDTLLNIYYLLRSEKVAGDLWPEITLLHWVQKNQLGVDVKDVNVVEQRLRESVNFAADGWLTCYFKRSNWSLRQISIDNRHIKRYGLQVYRPKELSYPKLLVIDIDVIVFSSIYTWPRHALDILWPDKKLNDPLSVRAALSARGIFPS